MVVLVFGINACAVDEGLEPVLVCPFVDGQVAFGALEVSRGLLEGVFIRSLGMLLLDFEELLNGRGSGDFLPDWLIRPHVGLGCLVGEELTVLAEVRFDDIDCETLVNSGMARLALVPTPVWYPLVFVGLPGSLALVDEPFLVLFGGMASPPDWFVVEVVLGILVDLLEPGGGLFVYLEVILVQGVLPVLCLSVVEGGSPFVGGQCSISLSPAKVWLVGWGVR